MSDLATPPQNPAGAYLPKSAVTPAERAELIAVLESAPAQLRNLVERLSTEQLNTRYKNWSIRQIIHHIADSHVNAYIRFKAAITEDNPTIKPYDETKCSELPDAKEGCILPPLALVEAIHVRWVQLLKTMNDDDFARTYFHPEYQKKTSLNAALDQYAWHTRHHIAQIRWILDQKGW
jgi:hypothetical protein